MQVIALEKCKYCGEEPMWLNTPFGSRIACKGNKGKCDENIIAGSDFVDAINNWNKAQVSKDD